MSAEGALVSDREAAGGRANDANASDADIREFREISRTVRRRLWPIQARFMALFAAPCAIYFALRGIRAFGRAIRERNGVGLPRQFLQLIADYLLLHARPDTYYVYQFYLDSQRKRRRRHFAQAEVFHLEHYLIEAEQCADARILSSKHLFARRAAELGLPTVPVLAEFLDGRLVAPQSAELVKFPASDLFSKPSDAWCGVGATLWHRAKPDVYVNAESGEAFDRAALVERLGEESKAGRILLQEKIENHPALVGTLTLRALATVRFPSCRSASGEIALLPPVLRIPTGDAIVDNFAQGGLGAPIDLESGVLCGPAVRKDPKYALTFIERHPDTNVELVGFRLPYWERVRELVLSAHRAFPSLHSAGWDVAILPDRPVIVEGNALWDVDLTVLAHRITLSDTPFIPGYNARFRRYVPNARAPIRPYH